MNFNPKVTIVTPSYNQGEFIEDTILSIKNQKYKNFEHIVVDAGSTDNTLDILRKYAGTYDLTWSSEPDEGMYQAINKGLKRAKGEVLCYLNTDDLYLPWTLEAVVRYFSKSKQVDLIYGDIINLEDSKGTLELTFCPPFKFKWKGLYQPAVFWRRRAYESVGGFDENLQVGGDYEYWLRISERCTAEKINEFLAVDRNYYKRKCFVHSNLSDAELVKIRSKYGLPPSPNGALRLFYRLYSYFWTRCYMALFIVQLLKNGSKNEKLWPFFFSSEDLLLPSISRLLLRFLPYIGKRKGPWHVSKLHVGIVRAS